MKKITSKLPDIGTTIFTVMGQLAHQHNAVNLSQGFPNFNPDPKLLALFQQALRENHNQYAPMQGIFSLRESIVQKIAALYGKNYHPESEITVTAGATQAIFTAISAFVNSGDEVIVFKPAYDCYEPAIALQGATVVPIALQGTNFTIDWEEVRLKITSKTKMVIINSPHNPSGTILSKEDMLQLEVVLENSSCILLSDEVYEHIVFDGGLHESVAKYPRLAERSILCASFGKTFHVTGWKIGYVAGPKALMKEFNKVHQFNVFCVNHPVQHALAKYLKEPGHYLSLGAFYEEKRDYFLAVLKGSRFRFTPAQGTYFQTVDYSKISDENAVDFSKRLIVEKRLASIPLSVFNLNNTDNKQLRLCFAKTKTTLDKAAEILNAI